MSGTHQINRKCLSCRYWKPARRENLVDFEYFCPKCKNAKLDEHKDPCDECLTYSVNTNSTQPVLYEEA